MEILVFERSCHIDEMLMTYKTDAYKWNLCGFVSKPNSDLNEDTFFKRVFLAGETSLQDVVLQWNIVYRKVTDSYRGAFHSLVACIVLEP